MSKKESKSKVILSLEDYRILDAYKQMFEKNSFIILTGGDLCLSVTKDEVISEMEGTIRRCNKEIFDLKEFNKVLKKESIQVKSHSNFLIKLFKN